MQFHTYNEAKQHLLHAFNLLAPSGVEQNAMRKLVLEMEADRSLNFGNSDVIERILSVTLDGVQYGNWPR